MRKLYRILKPLANRYSVLLIWFFAIFNFYLCVKPLKEYAASIGLNETPTILDTMTYYTPDEGYQTLSNLGDDGRRAYRLTNNAEFVFPILLFLSLSLSNLVMGKGHHYITGPFLYMIFEYIENLAEKYVLEIYPNRHDTVMKLACYAGLINTSLDDYVNTPDLTYTWKHLITSQQWFNKPIINDVTKIKLSDVSVVGNSLTKCVIKSNDVLEITTHLSEGGCAVPFEQLKLPIKKSLSNQVLEFDMKFLTNPYDGVGRHGGIYYGNHSFDRRADGNTGVDWIDRTRDRGYRFYRTGWYPDDSNVLLLQKKEPVNHLKIIIKSNGEHIIVAENTIWKNLTSNAVQLLNKPYLGFWAWGNNHLRISNFTIRPYTRCGLDE
ncbi:unnamed protein product [Adineta steineri]|uniref:Uncharacterized protein n=1 Tax=Adineta steineri TaxID=433720 RepID=A0A814Y3M1_9BILA|nr:unnamed protein product [Adineta steineri]CAF3808330.1 unnamed protein product [Adineta steineri]